MTILYEDNDIIICKKPPGLAVQTAKIGQQDLASQLRNYLARKGAKSPYLGIVHRLDQPVEGLLVFGKTKGATAGLNRQLQDGKLQKNYYGVIWGIPEHNSGELVDYLTKDGVTDKAPIMSERVKPASAAKKAILRYQVVDGVVTPFFASLLDISIETGRFHQIRIQLSHAGLPLLGDRKYANEDVLEASHAAKVENVALCAYQIKLTHPKTGKKLSFSITPEGKAFTWFDRFKP